MNQFKGILVKHANLILIYILLGISISFLNSYSVTLFRSVLDAFAGGSLELTAILRYGAVLLLACGLGYADNGPDSRLEREIFLSLKLQALEKAGRIDYLACQSLGTGKLVQQIETGSAAGQNMLYGFWLRLVRELLPSVVFSVAFLGAISRPVMGAVLAGYVLVFLLSNVLLRALYRVKARVLDHEEQMNRLLVRGLMELAVFRVNRRFRGELQKAARAKDVIVDSKVTIKLIHEAFFALFEALVCLVKVGLILYAWHTGALTVGAVIALISLLDRAYTPIAVFNVLFIQYKLDRVAFQRYADFLAAADDPALEQGKPLANARGRIDVQGLSLRLKGRDVLRDVDIEIPWGEKVMLAGESGAGKSTLVKLLLGLLKPTEGRILIGGEDLSAVRLNSYYRHVAYVSQDAPVFDGSLRENLTFGAPVGDRLLLQALSAVRLAPLLNKLEHGLDTQIGERGVLLSGGERQRLALARLWFRQADLVILDEAFSAMDGLTEAQVLRAVMERLRDKTVLVVAHRLRAAWDFDRIVVFRDGGIVGNGPLHALLRENAYFKSLYELAY